MLPAFARRPCFGGVLITSWTGCDSVVMLKDMTNKRQKRYFRVLLKKGLIQYFYFSNLALEEKKHWVRKEYNREFLKNKALSAGERKAVLELANEILLLEELKINLLDYFILDDPWVKLSMEIPESSYLNLKTIFDTLGQGFQVFWDQFLQNESQAALGNLKLLLDDRKEWIEQILQHLHTFFASSTSRRKNETDIFLIILSASVKSGGGKYLSNGRGIIIEGNASRFGKIRTLEIILHEYIHSNLETRNYNKLLTESLNKLSANETRSLCEFYSFPSIKHGLKEMIANIVVTPVNKMRDNFSQLLFKAIPILKDKMNQYVNAEKSIDIDFVNYSLNLLREYKKE